MPSVPESLHEHPEHNARTFAFRWNPHLRRLLPRRWRTAPSRAPQMNATWHYLVECAHPWRKQLWVRNRRLMASTVWLDAVTHGMSVDETATNWDLSVEAVQEIFAYCETHRSLIEAESSEERRRLVERGIDPP